MWRRLENESWRPGRNKRSSRGIRSKKHNSLVLDCGQEAAIGLCQHSPPSSLNTIVVPWISPKHPFIFVSVIRFRVLDKGVQLLNPRSCIHDPWLKAGELGGFSTSNFIVEGRRALTGILHTVVGLVGNRQPRKTWQISGFAVKLRSWDNS